MNWKAIRLELADTPEFPQGSPNRAYMVRLPLGDDGVIDEPARAAMPAMATVRRFWPNQPDLRGYVVHTPEGWAFAYKPGDEAADGLCRIDSEPLLPGECITLTEPDGSRLPYRVASIKTVPQPPFV